MTLLWKASRHNVHVENIKQSKIEVPRDVRNSKGP